MTYDQGEEFEALTEALRALVEHGPRRVTRALAQVHSDLADKMEELGANSSALQARSDALERVANLR